MEVQAILEESKPKKYSIRNSDAFLMIVKPKPKELNVIRKKSSIKTRGARGLGLDFRIEIYNRLCMEKFITGWENIKLNGKDMACDSENKVLLDGNWSAFHECWDDVVSDEVESDESDSEEELKNS